eukprot:g3632.t1 g3632   contig12:2461299-2462790(+)
MVLFNNNGISAVNATIPTTNNNNTNINSKSNIISSYDPIMKLRSSSSVALTRDGSLIGVNNNTGGNGLSSPRHEALSQLEDDHKVNTADIGADIFKDDSSLESIGEIAMHGGTDHYAHPNTHVTDNTIAAAAESPTPTHHHHHQQQQQEGSLLKKLCDMTLRNMQKCGIAPGCGDGGGDGGTSVRNRVLKSVLSNVELCGRCGTTVVGECTGAANGERCMTCGQCVGNDESSAMANTMYDEDNDLVFQTGDEKTTFPFATNTDATSIAATYNDNVSTMAISGNNHNIISEPRDDLDAILESRQENMCYEESRECMEDRFGGNGIRGRYDVEERDGYDDNVYSIGSNTKRSSRRKQTLKSRGGVQMDNYLASRGMKTSPNNHTKQRSATTQTKSSTLQSKKKYISRLVLTSLKKPLKFVSHGIKNSRVVPKRILAITNVPAPSARKYDRYHY